jgi:hypothetical protein
MRALKNEQKQRKTGIKITLTAAMVFYEIGSRAIAAGRSGVV